MKKIIGIVCLLLMASGLRLFTQAYYKRESLYKAPIAELIDALLPSPACLPSENDVVYKQSCEQAIAHFIQGGGDINQIFTLRNVSAVSSKAAGFGFDLEAIFELNWWNMIIQHIQKIAGSGPLPNGSQHSSLYKYSTARSYTVLSFFACSPVCIELLLQHGALVNVNNVSALDEWMDSFSHTIKLRMYENYRLSDESEACMTKLSKVSLQMLLAASSEAEQQEFLKQYGVKFIEND